MGLGDGRQLLEKLRENDCAVDGVLDSQSLALALGGPAPGGQDRRRRPWGAPAQAQSAAVSARLDAQLRRLPRPRRAVCVPQEQLPQGRPPALHWEQTAVSQGGWAQPGSRLGGRPPQPPGLTAGSTWTQHQSAPCPAASPPAHRRQPACGHEGQPATPRPLRPRCVPAASPLRPPCVPPASPLPSPGRPLGGPPAAPPSPPVPNGTLTSASQRPPGPPRPQPSLLQEPRATGAHSSGTSPDLPLGTAPPKSALLGHHFAFPPSRS